MTTQIPDSWSPDGKYLLFQQASEAGDADLWIVPIDSPRTPRPFLRTKFSEEYAAFSPDGHWVAYESNESGKWEIYATSYPKAEEKLQISTGGGNSAKWAKHGSEIIYFNYADSKFMRVPISYTPELHPGRAEELFQISDELMYTPDVSADGERISAAIQGRHARISKLIVVVNWFAELEKQLSAR
jgi:Tol biopolymer transport system component